MDTLTSFVDVGVLVTVIGSLLAGFLFTLMNSLAKRIKDKEIAQRYRAEDEAIAICERRIRENEARAREKKKAIHTRIYGEPPPYSDSSWNLGPGKIIEFDFFPGMEDVGGFDDRGGADDSDYWSDPVSVAIADSIIPRNFLAVSNCPSCGFIATHYIKKSGWPNIERECVDCKFTWKERK